MKSNFTISIPINGFKLVFDTEISFIFEVEFEFDLY